MPSKFLRRSGVAVALIAELIEWEPEFIIQAGVGQHHQEVDVFREAWPDAHLMGCEPILGVYKSLEDTYPGEIQNIAIGATDEDAVTLWFARNHKDGASIHKNHEIAPYGSIPVPQKTLDSAFDTADREHGPDP